MNRKQVMRPIKKVSLSEEIINRFVEMVKNGQLKPNEKINSERELCEMFDTSRTSVREAIQGLTSMGILVKKRDGHYVCNDITDIITRPINMYLSTFTDLNMSEVFEARIAIETQIAQLAARKATAEDILSIEECLESVQSEPRELIMQRSMEFHRRIAASTHNRFLQEMYAVIYKIMQEMRSNQGSLVQVNKSQILHRDIVSAIKAHDPVLAEKVTRKHLLALQQAIDKEAR